MSIREAVDIGARRIDEELSDQPEIQSRLYLDLSGTYGNLGDRQRQKELIEKAYDPTIRAFGEESREFYRWRLANGSVSYAVGEDEAGREIMLALLEDLTSKYGPGDIMTIRARSSLANNLWALGDLEGFATHNKEILSNAEQSLGADHEVTLNAAHNIALALVNQGKYREAIDFAGKHLAIAKESLGPGHTATLSLLSILATAHGYNGELTKELEFREQIIERQIQARGEDHPSVASAKVNLAYVYNDLEEYSEVERLFSEAVEIWTRSVGATAAITLRGRRNLAMFRARQRLSETAIHDLDAVIDLQEETLGSTHPNTVESKLMRAELALLYDEPGTDAAIDAAIAEGVKVLGQNSPIMQRFTKAITTIRQQHDAAASLEEAK